MYQILQLDCKLQQQQDWAQFLEDISKTKELERSQFEREASSIHLATSHIYT